MALNYIDMTDGNATALTSCNFWQRRRFSCCLIMLSSVCHATLIPALCYLTAMWHLIAKYPIVICIRTWIRYIGVCFWVEPTFVVNVIYVAFFPQVIKSTTQYRHPHTHSQSGVKSSMYVSQQTKEKHKPIQENNYAAKLPKKKAKKSKRKRAQNVNQEHYLCGSFEVRLLPCHYDYCLLIIRATRRRLTYGSCICICICMCTYSVSFLSEQWDIAHARTRVASLPFPGECLQVRWSISLWA